MTTIDPKDLVRIADAAKLFPDELDANERTIAKWCNRGLNGVRLKSVRLGKHRVTHPEWISDFILAVAEEETDGDVPSDL